MLTNLPFMNYLNIPGLNNSGPHHWQSLWEERFPGRFSRVHQQDWSAPDKDRWISQLHASILEQKKPFIAVAHSLGCITLVHWAAKYHAPLLAGTLLVAPADVRHSMQPCFAGFCPIPLDPLPFPSITVASANDPYARIEVVREWSSYWGSQFIDAGHKGHINAASGLGSWEEGLLLLNGLTPESMHCF
jgi:predicted alpha/beta hydrolase family esterase